MKKRLISERLQRVIDRLGFVEAARDLDHRIMHATFAVHAQRLNETNDRVSQLEERLAALEADDEQTAG